MSKIPTGTFRRGGARWNGEREVVEFVLDYEDERGARAIPCAVTYEALTDLEGAGDEDSAEEMLALYEKHRDTVWSAIDDALKLGHFEPDGFLLARTRDFPRRP